MAKVGKMQEFECYLPVKVVFGRGKLQLLGDITKQFGSNAFLIMDPQLAEIGLTGKILDLLKKSLVDVVVYTEIPPNPTYFLVDTVAQVAREKEYDVVIGIGGGSTLDITKGVAVLAKNSGKCENYINRPDQQILYPSKATLPIVAVPTTAGTGSEVTPYAVFTDLQSKEKRAINNETIFPKVALVDPDLMVSMPPELTAFTGVDALSHAIESYISIHSHPYSDLLALEAIKLVATNLSAAVVRSDNKDARSKMAWASTLAGMAIAHTAPGLAHALAQTVGGFCDAPHGKTIAACLARIMKFTFTSNLEKFAKIAVAMDPGCATLPLRERAERSADLVQYLLRDSGAETNFSLCGLKEKDINIVTDIAWTVYPRDINDPKQTTREDIRRLYEECMV